MSLWKSLVDRMKEKKDELQKQAVKKVARGALDSAGRVIDKALFGERPGDAPEMPEPPDPFAKLKAAETAKKESERRERAQAKERAAAQKKLDREVDAELAAMKDRLRK